MTQMYCAGLNPQGFGGYNAHPGDANPYTRRVPFHDAITDPPRCGIHDVPYLTLGGYRLARLMQRFAESGVLTAECSVYYGFEQAAGCPPHGWYGSAGETRDDRCPHQRLAAWIVRRHSV